MRSINILFRDYLRFTFAFRTIGLFQVMHITLCGVHIKQRLFSFKFGFAAHSLFVSHLLSPTIMWAWISWVVPTGECFLSVLDIIGEPPYHGCVIPEVIYVHFGEAVSWERLDRGYLRSSSGPSLPVTSFFQAEVIYVRFLLQCKTRLFTFISLKSREPKRLMVFPERKIVLHLTLCNSYFATSALFPLIPHRALLESFL